MSSQPSSGLFAMDSRFAPRPTKSAIQFSIRIIYPEHNQRSSPKDIKKTPSTGVILFIGREG
ncbi:TPA: hypothetical protein IAA86_06365 [Candidatus Galligastranaerophilus intestinavium]|uniref:Uncharacterized protein n=1 Tax=Candidatus Galligastranaerophilus intestinavium TaxID=2840836 RepID=A0A9D1FK08_9BACT|nr:hypothetical protein [Candidatus Galligastranaerophilus intestinavium]